jgi:hypothetical protein
MTTALQFVEFPQPQPTTNETRSKQNGRATSGKPESGEEERIAEKHSVVERAETQMKSTEPGPLEPRRKAEQD